MSGKNTSQAQRRRAQKSQRRQTRQAKHTTITIPPSPAYPVAGLDGWNTFEDLEREDLGEMDWPDESLMDTSRCSLAAACAGCGGDTGLEVITSAFTRPGGFDIGCATLCPNCSGRSFLHLFHGPEFAATFTRHEAHAANAA